MCSLIKSLFWDGAPTLLCSFNRFLLLFWFTHLLLFFINQNFFSKSLKSIIFYFSYLLSFMSRTFNLTYFFEFFILKDFIILATNKYCRRKFHIFRYRIQILMNCNKTQILRLFLRKKLNCFVSVWGKCFVDPKVIEKSIQCFACLHTFPFFR